MCATHEWRQQLPLAANTVVCVRCGITCTIGNWPVTLESWRKAEALARRFIAERGYGGATVFIRRANRVARAWREQHLTKAEPTPPTIVQLTLWQRLLAAWEAAKTAFSRKERQL